MYYFLDLKDVIYDVNRYSLQPHYFKPSLLIGWGVKIIHARTGVEPTQIFPILYILSSGRCFKKNVSIIISILVYFIIATNTLLMFQLFKIIFCHYLYIKFTYSALQHPWRKLLLQRPHKHRRGASTTPTSISPYLSTAFWKNGLESPHETFPVYRRPCPVLYTFQIN